jgi:dTDP-4-amino-4,6-dideoxygalactose transaminase
MTMSEKRVPFNDLSRNEGFEAELNQKILDLINRGPYLKGNHTSEFEANFANYIGVNYCVGLANGTVALEVALKSLHLPKQSTILLAANAGGYSSIAVRNSGHLPKYIDVNGQGLISPTLKDFQTSNVGAIIVTHLYGQMCDMASIMTLANSLSIPVIEDCAQAAGARLNKQYAGSFGDISAFSFYPTKNLGAAGDAGAICTSNPKYLERVLQLREYGWSTKYFSHEEGGGNFRIDEIQSLILNYKLGMLNNQNAKRLIIWAKYKSICDKIGIPMLGTQDSSFVAHLAVLKIKDRNKFQGYLESLGIESAIHYPFPDYSQPGIYVGEKIHLPNTEEHCSEVISLPIFADMYSDEIEFVVDSIENFFKEGG